MNRSLLRSPVPTVSLYRIPDRLFPLRDMWRFLIAHTVGISARCRSFAPSWAVCKNPPFSPTAAPYPVTIVLSPTRKDTTKRHWQQPLVTGSSQRICLAKHAVALEVCAKVRLHWKDRFGCCALRKPVTTVQKLAGLLNLRKTTLPGGFFVYRTRDYDDKQRISRRS